VITDIDWSRAVVDSIAVRATKRGMPPGQTRSTARQTRLKDPRNVRPKRRTADRPDLRRERARLLGAVHRDEPLTAGEVAEVIAEFEDESTLVSRSGRTINRLDVVNAPAYVEPVERYNGTSILDDPGLKLRTALAEMRRLDDEVKQLETFGGQGSPPLDRRTCP
jgi:hypothetical protein